LSSDATWVFSEEPQPGGFAGVEVFRAFYRSSFQRFHQRLLGFPSHRENNVGRAGQRLCCWSLERGQRDMLRL